MGISSSMIERMLAIEFEAVPFATSIEKLTEARWLSLARTLALAVSHSRLIRADESLE